MSDRNTHRLSIKKAVEQAVPLMDIDVTKVLSEEECTELHRQIQQRSDAVALAREVGRAGLRARLKRTMLFVEDGVEEEATEDDRTSE